MNTEYTYRDDLNTKSGDYAEYAKVKDYIMCILDVSKFQLLPEHNRHLMWVTSSNELVLASLQLIHH